VTRRALASVAIALALVACKDERPIRMGEARATRRPELRDAGPAGAVGVETSDVSVGAAATDVDLEVEGDAPPPAPERVTDETCRAACQNALRLTLGELPEATSVKMREEIARVMDDECPKRCLERGSLASVRCIADAKTALELAACPR